MTIPCIAFSNEDISFTSKAKVELTKSSYKSFKTGKESITLRSEKVNINLENQNLHFYDNVVGGFTYNGKKFNLRTENLISNFFPYESHFMAKTLPLIKKFFLN